jgi:transcriptional regulator with XRE-family HTH domain
MYVGDSSIGETIRKLRSERGMSREELAEKAEISRSHLNKIEAGIKKPGINTYQKIMDILEVDLSIRGVEKTEKGKCVEKARKILMNHTENEAIYLVKILECVANNMDLVT